MISKKIQYVCTFQFKYNVVLRVFLIHFTCYLSIRGETYFPVGLKDICLWGIGKKIFWGCVTLTVT